jgi:hypothetical protein
MPCTFLITQVERLASSLTAESSGRSLVAKLDCSARQAKEYARRYLEVDTAMLPAVYIFPEGKRGFARYRGEPFEEAATLALRPATRHHMHRSP